MEIDQLLASINTKWKVSGPGMKALTALKLTEAEQAFLQAFTPERVFIVYGTLGPDGPNHAKVQHISGTWRKGVVMGKLESKGWGAALGYNGFTHVGLEEQQAIKADILVSDELEANWPLLDEFEGPGYCRLLAKFEFADGVIGVGNIYALQGMENTELT